MRPRCVQLEWLRRNDHICTTFIAKINKAVRMWFPPYEKKSLSIWLMLRARMLQAEQHCNGYLLAAWLSNNTNRIHHMEFWTSFKCVHLILLPAIQNAYTLCVNMRTVFWCSDTNLGASLQCQYTRISLRIHTPCVLCTTYYIYKPFSFHFTHPCSFMRCSQ
jgi:hypothetical protein